MASAPSGKISLSSVSNGNSTKSIRDAKLGGTLEVFGCFLGLTQRKHELLLWLGQGRVERRETYGQRQTKEVSLREDDPSPFIFGMRDFQDIAHTYL